MRHYKLRRHKGCERKCLPSETKVPSTGFKEIEVAQSFGINCQVCLVFKPYFVADFLVLLRSFPSIALRIPTAHNFTRD